MTAPRAVRPSIALLLGVFMLVSTACGGGNDTALETADVSTAEPSVAPAANTPAPSGIVAVDLTPRSATGATGAAGATGGTANDTATQLLVVDQAQISVPTEWVQVQGAQDLDLVLERGRATGALSDISDTTLSGWQALVANGNAGLVIDPATGQSASMLIAASSSSLSPITNPEGWIEATTAALAQANPELGYQAQPATYAGQPGVRSTLIVSNNGTEQQIEQFVTEVEAGLVTLTVGGPATADGSIADQVFASFQPAG